MSIEAVTVNRVFDDQGYYRVSLYEFKDSGILSDDSSMRAVFKEDLNAGAWNMDVAIDIAKKIAKKRGIQFIQNLRMGDSIDKIFRVIFKNY